MGIWSFRCCLLSRMYGMNPSGWWRRAERWWTGSNDVRFVLCRTLLPVVLAHMTAVTKYCRLLGFKEKKSVAHISGIWKVKRRGTCRLGVQWGHSSFFLADGTCSLKYPVVLRAGFFFKHSFKIYLFHFYVDEYFVRTSDWASRMCLLLVEVKRRCWTSWNE